jgi:methylmalonyl-CoA mutase N-terminal domain/subunit
MEGLENAARADDNLVPILLDAVRARATVGEISDVLRRVFGEYAPPLSI